VILKLVEEGVDDEGSEQIRRSFSTKKSTKK